MVQHRTEMNASIHWFGFGVPNTSTMGWRSSAVQPRLLFCIFMVELPAGRKLWRGFQYQLENLPAELCLQETGSDCRSQTFRPAENRRNVVNQNSWGELEERRLCERQRVSPMKLVPSRLSLLNLQLYLVISWTLSPLILCNWQKKLFWNFMCEFPKTYILYLWERISQDVLVQFVWNFQGSIFSLSWVGWADSF